MPPKKKQQSGGGWSFGGIRLLHAGGLGAVVLTLATQQLAQEIVGGIALHVQDLIHVGDEVWLGRDNDVQGIITELGWIGSSIRGYDDLVIHIPNSQLIHSRVTNVSKGKRSQVKQILRFQYKDLEKVPKVLIEIKDELRTSCPKIVTEGAIYRAVITSYEPDHVQATVNVHFDIPAETEASNRNRQEALLTMARVMDKHGMEFAPPVLSTTRVGLSLMK